VFNVQYAEDVRAGLPGLSVAALLNGRQFLGGVAPKTSLRVSLKNKAAKGWKVGKCDIAQYLPNGKLMPALADANVTRHDSWTQIEITGLVDGPTYKATIHFEPTAADFAKDGEEMGNLSEEAANQKDRMNVLRAAWRKVAKSAQKEISAGGEINVTLDP
jgi:hypothetical protein